MSELLARARHTETEAVFEIFNDGRGGLEAVPASAGADTTFIGSLPAIMIDPALAGNWRHFKGGLYEFVTRVTSPEGQLILYRDSSGSSWLRPLVMVSELVERDGRCEPRFARVTEA